MKTFFTCIFLLFSFILEAQISQSSQWSWIKGDSTSNAFGIYGTQGVASPANKPGSRNNAVTWTDRNGNMWLFGGLGYAAAGSGVGYLNDLWMYDPSANQWTWVKGDDFINNLGAYGPKGSSDPSYKPTARKGAVTWTDLFGNLWLFGGKTVVDITEAYLNDLWMFDIVSGQWTFVSGDNTINSQPVYGTKGTSAAENKPGGRELGIAWSSGFDLWLFGGVGTGNGGDNSAYPALNDLWKYDINLNQWTWISGSNYLQSHGTYGSLGIGDTANSPGARSGSVSWKDISGNMWLFGGFGFANSSGAARLNDLWKYEPSNNKWMWVKGDSNRNVYGKYGTQGTPAFANKPGARELAVAGVDTSGDFLLYEGVGYTTGGNLSNLNDLWKYNVSTNQWTWLKGDSTTNTAGSSYGTEGSQSLNNKPGARNSAGSWTDLNGNFWIFGGFGYTSGGMNSYLNDLWKLSPSIVLPVTYISTNSECKNGNAVLTWQTTREANSQRFDIERSAGNSWTIIGSVNAAVNSTNINTYTFTDLAHQEDGLYRIVEIDRDGRKLYSTVLWSSCRQIQKLDVWPNPAKTIVNIQSTELIKSIQVLNAEGKLLFNVSPDKNNYNLQISRYPIGQYVLRIEIKEGIINKKIIKN